MALEALAAAVGGTGPSGTPGQGLVGALPVAPTTRRRVHPRYHLDDRQIDQLEELAAELRAVAAAAGLSATHVARTLGNRRLAGLLSPRGIRKDARRPRIDTLRRIADLAGLPADTADQWAARWPDAVGATPTNTTTRRSER